MFSSSPWAVRIEEKQATHLEGELVDGCVQLYYLIVEVDPRRLSTGGSGESIVVGAREMGRCDKKRRRQDDEGAARPRCGTAEATA